MTDIRQRFLVTDQSTAQKRKKNIPAGVLHQLQLRDQESCTYVDVNTGRRCFSQRYLEAHHIQPFSSGVPDPHLVETPPNQEETTA